MRRPDLGRAGAIVGSMAGVIGAVLAPKCPLCAAAMLTALGASSTAALEVAPFVRVIAVVVAALSAVVFATLAWRRRLRATAARCVVQRTRERRMNGGMKYDATDPAPKPDAEFECRCKNGVFDSSATCQ
jgi:hypothetical protein